MAEAHLVVQNIGGVVVANFREASILDAQAIEAIGQQLYEIVDEKAQRKILLDFSRVRFLSSSLLGVLISLQKKAQSIKGQVAICSLRKDLKKPFQITHLDKLFKFYDDEEEALNSYGVYTT
ncbi:MAG: STAS domain-containing protein [Phycisphaerae bacterium]|nr:STAS domain-containing protein [Phycisphaerae bacterium]